MFKYMHVVLTSQIALNQSHRQSKLEVKCAHEKKILHNSLRKSGSAIKSSNHWDPSSSRSSQHSSWCRHRCANYTYLLLVSKIWMAIDRPQSSMSFARLYESWEWLIFDYMKADNIWKAPTWCRAASNCGLMRVINSAVGVINLFTASKTVNIEMNDMSSVTRPTGMALGRSLSSRYRILVRSITVTRSSCLTRSATCVQRPNHSM